MGAPSFRVGHGIGWEEVEDAAAKMFSISVDGNELKWAREAWRSLAAASLAGGGTILEITETKLRLVTLAHESTTNLAALHEIEILSGQ